jgi:hypothetical protein
MSEEPNPERPPSVDLERIAERIERLLVRYEAAVRNYRATEERPIDDRARDGTPILAWNGFFGWYVTQYVDGQFPCGFSGGQLGDWFPVPTCYRELPAIPASALIEEAK